jgi:hypothetical protein
MAEPAFSMAEPAGGGETHHRSVLETPLAFGKSKAKFQMEPNTGVTFADVAAVCSFRFPNHVPTIFFFFFFKP